MIRAWTLLNPKAKNPQALDTSVSKNWFYQYPLFPTFKDARLYRHEYNLQGARIVRCQIRVEGQK